MPRPLARLALAALALGAVLAVLPAAGAELRAPGETPLADVLQLVFFERRVVAIDGLAGAEKSEDLLLGERVLWGEARGRVGVVLTDQRVLAVATRSASWQAERYQRGEAPPPNALLGEQVALVVTSRRALGFNSGSGNLTDVRLGPRERVIAADVSGAVGVVVTDRRALGVSPFAGGFFEARLGLGEDIESLAATGNVATLRTSRRILTFQAVGGAWVELDRDLAD
jgi:hypothetical protein